ncbi:MAG: hypothetical protein LBC18_07895 [Opitutaceae bacterium]|nr:hypothetical protein [Opitutaceae bacterium]
MIPFTCIHPRLKNEPLNPTAKDAKDTKSRKNETEKTTAFRISFLRALRVLRGYKKSAIILNREKRQNTRKRPLLFSDISRFSRFK